MLASILELGSIAGVPLQSDGAGAAIMLVVWLFVLALSIVSIAGMWKVYAKAEQPGWGALIPIYNVYLMLKIAGRPGWWLLLFMIPFVNWIMAIVVSIDIAKSFGKGAGYGLGLAFLSFVFYPLLGFGDEQYLGPSAA
jgi:uncharacterized membrane protein YhaH (DUF805 family)